MLFKETVTKGTLDLIIALMRDPLLENFYLVGGTALSLKIGHRKSIDIDLFTSGEFDSALLGDYLKANYGAKLTQQFRNCVKGQVDGVEFDFISHRYPHVRPPESIEEIRMMSLEDIAAMKINAIVGSGTRIKDFIDIHYLLKRMWYADMLKYYCAKYPNVTPDMARSSLLYYHDINFKVPVVLYDAKLKWKDVETSIKRAIADYEKDLGKPRTYLKESKTNYFGLKKQKGRGHDNGLGM